MKKLLILIYIIIVLIGCKVFKNEQKYSEDFPNDIILKINSNDIGDVFSEDIIHSVKGRVKSVEFSNHKFSKTDSAFVPVYYVYLDSYHNCIYNINEFGQIENRIILNGENKEETGFEKYEITPISIAEFKVEYKQYRYEGGQLSDPDLYPKYTEFYRKAKLIKRQSLYNTAFYEYNDLGKISLIKIIHEGRDGGEVIEFLYDENNRLSEKHHHFGWTNQYFLTKYIYQENSLIKINVSHVDDKISSIDINYFRYDEFDNITERRRYDPLKSNREILELENDTDIIDQLISTVKNSDNNWLIYSQKYTYEFDKNNNWITKTFLTIDNEPNYRLKRNIEYY